MIFNPKEGGRLVLPVDEGSLVVDVRSARLTQHSSSMHQGDSRTTIRLECDLIGTIVYKDPQEDRTEAVILQGEKDDPDAIVLSTKHLTDVNVSTNFPGSTEITIEAWGLPIQYSKLVEKALQDKPKPVGPGNAKMAIHHAMLSGSGYSSPLSNLIVGSHTPSPLQSIKVWPGVSITDEEILEALDDQED